ncbi:MAG: hypothetical protein ACW981_07395 [Candidatus Hodarchaeales archaeon]|jgi:hypothetical protein
MDIDNSIGLNSIPQKIVLEVNKSRKIVKKQLYSSFYSILLFILIFFIFLSIQGEPIQLIELVIITVNTGIFSLVAINNILFIWPIWRKISFKLNLIEKTVINEDYLIQRGFTSYINYFITSMRLSENIKIKVDRNWIIHILIGIFVVDY